MIYNQLTLAMSFLALATLFGCTLPFGDSGGAPATPPPSAAGAALAVAEKDDLVSVEYVGMLEDGTVFDTNLEQKAIEAGLPLRDSYELLTFTIGGQQMIEGFDAAVRGMHEGQEKKVTLTPSQAYGERSDDNIVEVPLEQIANAEKLQIGFEIFAKNGMRGKVVAIKDGKAKIDFNHELAGKNLVFEIKLVKLQKNV